MAQDVRSRPAGRSQARPAWRGRTPPCR